MGGIRLVTVGAAQFISVGMKHNLHAGNEIHMDAPKIVLEAKEMLQLKCGAGTIQIDAAGIITINGPKVKINS